MFSKYFKLKIGPHDLIYTRSSEGRKLLLKARMKNIKNSEKRQRRQEYSQWR